MSEEMAALLIAVVLVPLLWALLWLGWRGRARRQGGLAPLPPVPDEVPEDVLEDVEAVYVTSTLAGQPLERVVARGLGVRSNAAVRVSRSGVLVARQGAPDVWIPAGALLGVRRERGMVGKVVEREGLVVIRWQLGDTDLDTGLRVRRSEDRDRLVAAVTTLLEVTR